MDISKLKFDIHISYNCDEGEGCDATLEDGTYEQAKHLLEDLDGRTWIIGYYHYMSIHHSLMCMMRMEIWQNDN